MMKRLHFSALTTEIEDSLFYKKLKAALCDCLAKDRYMPPLSSPVITDSHKTRTAALASGNSRNRTAVK